MNKSFSKIIIIAEDSSRFNFNNRKNIFIISMGSAFECVAILEFLFESNKINEKTYENLLSKLEEISKMLFVLIKNLE